MQIKKLLGSALALAIVFQYSQVSAAELLKNFKVGGQIDVQATSANNIKDFATRSTSNGVNANTDRLGDVQTRIMVHTDWDLLDDVHSRISLTKNDRTWGNGGGNQVVNANSQAIVGNPAGGGGIADDVFIDQAYFKVDKLFGHVDTTVGRQFYGDAGDLVIYFGPSDKAEYGLPTNALDALRADWANDKVGITAVGAKITGSPIGTATSPANKDLRGIVATLKGNEMVNGGVYLWNQLTHAAGPVGSLTGKADNLYVLGAKVKATHGGCWVKGEIARNFGENRAGLVTQTSANYNGWAFLLDAGHKADLGFGALTGWGQFGYGTGQRDFSSNQNRTFTAIAGDYRPGSIYGRFAAFTNGSGGQVGLGSAATSVGTNVAANTLANRVIWGVGVKVSPAAVNKLTAGVSYWDYRTQTAFAPVLTGRQAGFAGNKHIGSEIDVDLSWAHSENVTFGTGVGTFQPGGLIKEANQPAGGAATGQPNNPATLAYGDIRVKF